jgi:predicted esterase
MRLAVWVSGVFPLILCTACGDVSSNPVTSQGTGGSSVAGFGGNAAGGAGYAGYPAGGAGYAGYAASGAGYGGYAGVAVAGNTAGMAGAPVGGAGGAAGYFPVAGAGVAGGGAGSGGGSGASGSAGTVPTAGIGGAAGTVPAAGTGGPVNTSSDPVIPPITGTCPAFQTGTISFMGLGGIQMEVGPKAPGPTAPMLLYWHGTGSMSGEYAMSFMGAPAVAQGITSQGGVIVSFQNTSGVGDCSCSGTFIFCMGDMDIMDQFVACAVRDYNVDPRRIFTMGCSAGGLFSTCMAANRSQYIAAAAPNSGGFPVLSQPFSSAHIPALMTVHGAPGVDVVAIDFSQSSKIADDTFKNAGGFVINCNHGGGHCGGTVVDDQVWEFFQAHPYGVDPYPWTGGLPADFPSYCIIY